MTKPLRLLNSLGAYETYQPGYEPNFLEGEHGTYYAHNRLRDSFPDDFRRAQIHRNAQRYYGKENYNHQAGHRQDGVEQSMVPQQSSFMVPVSIA